MAESLGLSVCAFVISVFMGVKRIYNSNNTAKFISIHKPNIPSLKKCILATLGSSNSHIVLLNAFIGSTDSATTLVTALDAEGAVLKCFYSSMAVYVIDDDSLVTSSFNWFGFSIYCYTQCCV